jgi:uracil-DNA glycosylase family 4
MQKKKQEASDRDLIVQSEEPVYRNVNSKIRSYFQKNNCASCPFKSRTCESRGPKTARIAIVGESPGVQEISRGVPFIGPSGELLSTLLREVGIPEDEVYITNALSCLPPRSKDKDGNSVKDQKINEGARACRHRMFGELVNLPNLQLVISMGSIALRSLSEAWGASILKKRGQVLDTVTIPTTEWLDELGKPKPRWFLPRRGTPLAPLGVLPTLHPAYILRNQAALPQLRADLLKAKKLLDGEGFPQPTVEYRVLNTPGEIEHVIRLHTQQSKDRSSRAPFRVVADIETTGLDRYACSFICIGFQFEHKITEGRNVVYVVTGKGRGTMVRHLFATMPRWVEWVWHNGKFDTSFLRAKGIPRDQCRVDQDTLLLSYALDETGARHSLEQCIIDHLGLPAYKDMLSEYVGSGKKKKAYEDVPRPLLYEYMSKDVVFTGLLFKKLAPLVLDGNKPHLTKAYVELLIPASNALATIELNGMPIDQTELEMASKELEEKIDPLLRKMARIARVENFNPNSPKQVLSVLKARGLKITGTDKDTLKKFKSDALVEVLLEYAKYRKLLSTYLIAFRKYGSRVHTSYLIHGTVTGRLSCVAEWTPVRTRNGLIPMADLMVGDEVWTHKDRYRKVTRTIFKGVDHMFDLHLSNGDVLSCTADHRLLTTSNEWISVGDLIDEHIKKVGIEFKESGRSSSTVSILGTTYHRADFRKAFDNIPQRLACDPSLYVGGGANNSSQVALLSVEDWGQESNAQQYGNCTSKMEGRLRRWVRLLDMLAQWETAVRASSGHGQSIGIGGASQQFISPSYRRQSSEQRSGQFGVSNKHRAQNYSLFAGGGQQVVEIEKINYRGRLEVYDISVDEDESYSACGVLSHNSSSPNMQNIPKEEIVRRHFKAPKGRVFVSFDYSQAELRSLAVLSGDKALIDIFASGKDMHSAVAADVYGTLFTSEPEFLADGKTENPIYNKYRRNAKTVNFGIVYGATEFTLMERLGITWEEANKLIIGWFAMFPDARRFMNECRRAPREGRPLVTVFGRTRRFYVITDQNRRGQENEAGNFPHQSMCSDFTLDAAIQIDRIAARGGLPGRACQINIIHDDNLFECDDIDTEVVKLVKLVRPIMQETPVRHGITALPFKSDAKKGYVWSSMQKIAGI